MTPVLMDHISPLIELKHWLCRIATMEETSDPPRPINIIEVVLDFKDRISKDVHKIKGKYRGLAKIQLLTIFNNDKQFIQQTAQKYKMFQDKSKLLIFYFTDFLKHIIWIFSKSTVLQILLLPILV